MIGIRHFLAQKIKKEFEKRKNSILCIPKNCDDKIPSNLYKHFPTIIKGKCEKDSLFTYFSNQKPLLEDPDREIREFGLHKFYLSIESTNCTNYITEFFRILRLNIIPVVVYPKKEYYEYFAPPNSYIHLEDFGYDLKRLAFYLKRVAKNFDFYVEYFLWKADYDTIHSREMIEQIRACELCSKLNTETSIIYYDSISKWFNSECTN